MPSVFNIDDGYTEITIKTDAGNHTSRLDLFESNNHFASLCDTHPDPIARANAWVEWLVSKGLPAVSHGVAFQIADAIIADVAAYKKKAEVGSGSADSAASTGSPSSA